MIKHVVHDLLACPGRWLVVALLNRILRHLGKLNATPHTANLQRTQGANLTNSGHRSHLTGSWRTTHEESTRRGLRSTFELRNHIGRLAPCSGGRHGQR